MPAGVDDESRNIDLLNIAFVELQRQVSRVSDFALGGANFLVQSHESTSTVDTSVGQHNWIVFNVALAMVGVWNRAGEGIQFGRADGADGRGRGGSVGR